MKTPGTQWDDHHIDVLASNVGEADVVYTRWETADGRQFPWSPYRRIAHLHGANFVGTEVLLSDDAAEAFTQSGADTVDDALRELAEFGFSFAAVNEITYRRP